MPNQHPSEMSVLQIIAALAVGTIAVLMVGIQPILLGELVDAHQVTLEGVGIVAMGEIIALGLGVIVGDSLLAGTWLKPATIMAALFAAALDVLTLKASGDMPMLGMRAAAGLAEGIMVWGTTGVVVRTANPARISAVFFVTQTLAQAVFGAVLANAVIPAHGWQGGFVALAALSLLPCILAFWQPPRLAPLASPVVSGFRWSASTIVPLLIVLVQMASLGSFWAYLEPLGKVAGLDARAAQTLISGVLVMQVLGGSVAAWAVRRLSVRWALACSSVVLLAIATVVYQLPAGSSLVFVVLCAVFGFVWLFFLPFHIGLAFRADSSGRLAGLIPAAQLLGSALGPLMASFLVQGDDASAVPLVSAAFAASAAILLGLRSDRAGAASQQSA